MRHDSSYYDTGVLYKYFKENYFMCVVLSLAQLFQIAKATKGNFLSEPHDRRGNCV
jgi:hypothetical protein